MAIPTLLSNLTTGAKTAMNTVQEKGPVVPTQWLAKKKLSDLTNIAKTSAQTVQWWGDLLNKTVGIAKQSKANVINQEHEATTQSLADFVATTQANPNINQKDLQIKFPEFKGKEQAVADFVTTIQAKPNITPDEIKTKFPELYPTYEPEPTLWEKIIDKSKESLKWISKITPIISPLAWAVQKVWTENVLNTGLWLLEWAASVWGAIWQWLAYLDPTITVDEYKRWQENIDAAAPQPIKNIRGTQAYSIWKEAGKIWASTALTRPIWWAAKWVWLLWRSVLWATEWVLGTAAYNTASGDEAFNRTTW